MANGEKLDFILVGHGGTTGRGQGQVFQHTAVGGNSYENVTLPRAFGDANYYAFVTNYESTSSYVYKTEARTASGFRVVSTSPFVANDKLDILAVSGGLGDILDTGNIAVLSASLVALSGSVDGHFNQLSGTIDAQFVSHAASRHVLAKTFQSTTGLAIANTETDIMTMVIPAGFAAEGDILKLAILCTQAGTNAASPTLKITKSDNTEIVAHLGRAGNVGDTGGATSSHFTLYAALKDTDMVSSMTTVKTGATGFSNGDATSPSTVWSSGLTIKVRFISGNAANTYTFFLANLEIVQARAS
jgi:hypothetical protein